MRLEQAQSSGRAPGEHTRVGGGRGEEMSLAPRCTYFTEAFVPPNDWGAFVCWPMYWCVAWKAKKDRARGTRDNVFPAPVDASPGTRKFER